jgi:hypothetical protein
MPRRLDPRTLLHVEVEKRLEGCELAGDYAEPVRKTQKLADLLWAEEDAAQPASLFSIMSRMPLAIEPSRSEGASSPST